MSEAALDSRRRTRRVFNLCRCGECKVCIFSARRDKAYKPRKPRWMDGYDGPSPRTVTTAAATAQLALYVIPDGRHLGPFRGKSVVMRLFQQR